MKTYNDFGHYVDNGTVEMSAYEAILTIRALSNALEFVHRHKIRGVYSAGNFNFVVNPDNDV